MDQGEHWTNFDAHSFGLNVGSEEPSSSGEESHLSKGVSSSSDNKSSTRKPRKYFQKLLQNEVQSFINSDSEYSGPAESWKEHKLRPEDKAFSNAEKHQAEASSEEEDSRFRNEHSILAAQLSQYNNPNQKKQVQEVPRKSWEKFGTNYYAQKYHEPEKNNNHRETTVSQHDGANENIDWQNRHPMTKSDDIKIDRSYEEYGSARKNSTTPEPFTVRSEQIRSRVQNLVRQHEQKESNSSFESTQQSRQHIQSSSYHSHFQNESSTHSVSRDDLSSQKWNAFESGEYESNQVSQSLSQNSNLFSKSQESLFSNKDLLHQNSNRSPTTKAGEKDVSQSLSRNSTLFSQSDESVPTKDSINYQHGYQNQEEEQAQYAESSYDYDGNYHRRHSAARYDQDTMTEENMHLQNQRGNFDQNNTRSSKRPSNTDAEALHEFRQRRESLEPSNPIQRGNVEMKRRMLEQNQRNNSYNNQETTFGEDAFEALHAFLDEYQFDGQSSKRESLPPSSPVGMSRPQTASQFPHIHKQPSAPKPKWKNVEEASDYDHLELKESSSSLSRLLHIDTATTEDDDDDVGLNSPHDVAWPSQYGHTQHNQSQIPSPTQFRSEDSAEEDEREIRAAARQNGIPSPIVDIILRQSKGSRSQNQKIGEALTGYAKYDSDTGLPASTRHLYGDQHQMPGGFNTGRSWEEAEEENCEWTNLPTNDLVAKSNQLAANATELAAQSPYGPMMAQHGVNDLRRDPSPNAHRQSIGMHSIGERPDIPEGATDEELTLLNRFIEVASGNFGGNKLSAESEARVRAAALKVGLTPKFIDQLMRQHEQAHHSDDANNSPFDFVQSQPEMHQYHDYPPSVPPSVPAYGGEASTYYSVDVTRTTKQTKKTEASEAGCSVWDTISKNFGYALAKTCGIKNPMGQDDGSSISSAPSWDDNVGGSIMKNSSTGKSKRRRRRSGQERKDRPRDGHYEQEQQPKQYNHEGRSISMTAATPNSHMRGLV